MVINFPPGHRMTSQLLRAGITALLNVTPGMRTKRPHIGMWHWQVSIDQSIDLHNEKDGSVTIWVSETLHDTAGPVIQSWLNDSTMQLAYDKAKEKHG